MNIEKLPIEGAWIARSAIHSDERGFFREWFRASEIDAVIGRAFQVRQSNISLSHRGVLRGIHYSLAPEGQGKWITCVAGSIQDVVVDIRPSSSTYKKWITVNLRGDRGEAVFISEGLGHGFISLEDNSIVSYLLTTPYSPQEEFEINPLDPELAIDWALAEQLMSPKDSSAPTLSDRLAEGKLPN
jgi:dTDP-4-dehydrorhamnose 3,5-epimerase